MYRSLLLLAFCLSFLSACSVYNRNTMAKTRLEKINPSGLNVYLLDAAHPFTRGWYLADPVFAKGQVSGFAYKMAEVETIEAAMIRDRFDAAASKNDILLYAKPQFAASLSDTATLTILHADLEKVEVCEFDHMKAIGWPMVGCTGVFLGAFLFSGELAD